MTKYIKHNLNNVCIQSRTKKLSWKIINFALNIYVDHTNYSTPSLVAIQKQNYIYALIRGDM